MSSCRDSPLETYYAEIKSFGYIPYTIPLQFGSPGMIIGGAPDNIQYISHPYYCFPAEVDGQPTNLRYRNDSDLPYHNKKVRVELDLHADFLDAVKVGTPSIRAGTKISSIKAVEIEYRGAHVEYMDTIMTGDFYKEHVSEKCKDYLDRVGFVIQSLAVDSMNFKFYSKTNERYYVDVNNIEEFLDISADIAWSVDKEGGININTPKYIGYALGQMTRSEDGIYLRRAAKIQNNKYSWLDLTNIDQLKASALGHEGTLLRDLDIPGEINLFKIR